jgi:hypothetical protein
LDAAAQGAAAVRSEAKDERRSREQSLRAHQFIKVLTAAEHLARCLIFKTASGVSRAPPPPNLSDRI